MSRDVERSRQMETENLDLRRQVTELEQRVGAIREKIAEACREAGYDQAGEAAQRFWARMDAALGKEDGMKLSVLRAANIARCEEVYHPLTHWSPAEWACALAGEAGEVCNAVKKLRRLDDGTNTAKDPQTQAEAVNAIGAELADTIIYADLLAARLGIDLSFEIQRKFNEVSRRMNSTVRLGSMTWEREAAAKD